MRDEESSARINAIRPTLDTELKETRYSALRTEISSRIGPLGRPSKMPGFSWGISAEYCRIGSQLAKIKGTPCSVCYALRGHYPMPNVRAAQERRLNGFNNDPDWAELMAIHILTYAERHRHFRWFDSGDVQSLGMMLAIHSVCNQTIDFIEHWLPTQERRIAMQTKEVQPNNLIVRISSTKLHHNEPNHTFPTSFVGLHETEGVFQCPSSKQQNKCQECRACWDANVPSIEYHQH